WPAARHRGYPHRQLDYQVGREFPLYADVPLVDARRPSAVGVHPVWGTVQLAREGYDPGAQRGRIELRLGVRHALRERRRGRAESGSHKGDRVVADRTTAQRTGDVVEVGSGAVGKAPSTADDRLGSDLVGKTKARANRERVSGSEFAVAAAGPGAFIDGGAHQPADGRVGRGRGGLGDALVNLIRRALKVPSHAVIDGQLAGDLPVI